MALCPMFRGYVCGATGVFGSHCYRIATTSWVFALGSDAESDHKGIDCFASSVWLPLLLLWQSNDSHQLMHLTIESQRKDSNPTCEYASRYLSVFFAPHFNREILYDYPLLRSTPARPARASCRFSGSQRPTGYAWPTRA